MAIYRIPYSTEAIHRLRHRTIELLRDPNLRRNEKVQLFAGSIGEALVPDSITRTRIRGFLLGELGKRDLVGILLIDFGSDEFKAVPNFGIRSQRVLRPILEYLRDSIDLVNLKRKESPQGEITINPDHTVTISNILISGITDSELLERIMAAEGGSKGFKAHVAKRLNELRRK